MNKRMTTENKNQEKKQFHAKVDVIKDALTAATTLIGLIVATKAAYQDPPGYTAHTFSSFLTKAYPSIAPFIETLMFHVTLDSNIELDKIKEAYEGKTEKSQEEVEDEAKLDGGTRVKDWLKNKKNGSIH